MVVGYVIVLVIIYMYYTNGIGNSNDKKLPSFVVR